MTPQKSMHKVCYNFLTKTEFSNTAHTLKITAASFSSILLPLRVYVPASPSETVLDKEVGQINSVLAQIKVCGVQNRNFRNE